jgi:hypothetical protein
MSICREIKGSLKSQLLAAGAGLAACALGAAEPPVQAEVVVYGGTPAGVMAAVAAARHGRTVALVDINARVGGVVSGGLVATDIGDRETVGGLADEFFKRVAAHYEKTYGADSKQMKSCRNGIVFEPKVAELVFEQMLAEQAPRIARYRLNRYQGACVASNRVVSLTTEDLALKAARIFAGEVFIDASYEGDLMAGAGVPYRVGREARAEYGETLAGVSAGPKAQRGLGDHRTMAYNYRVAVTWDTTNRVLFPKPAHYDPAPFRATDGARAISGRIKGFGDLFTTTEKVGPNGKFDANWCDFIGNSEGYAEGDWAARERIAARIRDYFQSRLYYLQNDPELPEAFREETRKWGLPKDEFADTGNFPFQLYVREARRMLGRAVLTERDLTQDRYKADSVCAGSYGIDCHTVQEILNEGKLEKDHTRHVSVSDYSIPYACLTPIEPANLLVPVCLSATHVAYCSLRMEPVFMMLGHAAGDAAHLALADKTSVQGVAVGKLHEALTQEGAILESSYQPPVEIAWTPAHPKVGEAVTFTAMTGTLKDPLQKIWWNFEGAGAVDAQEDKAQHAFGLDKVYSVSLLAEDAKGRRRLASARVPVGAALAEDVTLDDFDADLFGNWQGCYPEVIRPGHTRAPDVFVGPGMQRDAARAGKVPPARARFQPALPRGGRYRVCVCFRPAPGQTTKAPVTVRHAAGVAKLDVNQREEATPFPFVAAGDYRFKAGDEGYVEIRNGEALDGRVVVDGVRWVWLGE